MALPIKILSKVSNGWKDTILKILVGVFISNMAWFMLWSQSVATTGWVKDETQNVWLRINSNTSRVEMLEKENIGITKTLLMVEKELNTLGKAVRELTQEIVSLKIELASQADIRRRRTAPVCRSGFSREK